MNYSIYFIKLIDPKVKLFSRKYIIKGIDKEDVAQELRLQLWRKINQYDPARGAFNTWSYWVMRNRLIDMTRRKVDILDLKNCPFDEDEM